MRCKQRNHLAHDLFISHTLLLSYSSPIIQKKYPPNTTCLRQHILMCTCLFEFPVSHAMCSSRNPSCTIHCSAQLLSPRREMRFKEHGTGEGVRSSTVRDSTLARTCKGRYGLPRYGLAVISIPAHGFLCHTARERPYSLVQHMLEAWKRGSEHEGGGGGLTTSSR